MKKYFLFFLCLFFCSPVWASKKEKKEQPPKVASEKVVKKLWSQSLKTGGSHKKYYPEMASPIVADGKVFVGTHSGIFYALDEGSGRVLWKFLSSGPIASQAVSDGHQVYFGNNKGMIYALDVSSGSKQWELFVGGEVLAAPSIGFGELYVVNTSREVSSIGLSSGDLRWSTYVKGYDKAVTMRGNSPVVVSGDRLYLGFSDGQVVSLSIQGGDVLWSKNLADSVSSFSDVDGSLVVENGVIYASGYFGNAYALSASSGQVLWKKELKSGTDLVVDSERVYASTTGSQVLALDKQTGRPRWEISLSSGTLSAPLVVGDYVVVGTQSGSAYLLGKEKGSLVQKMSFSDGYLGNAVADNNKIFFLSSGGQITSWEL